MNGGGVGAMGAHQACRDPTDQYSVEKGGNT